MKLQNISVMAVIVVVVIATFAPQRPVLAHDNQTGAKHLLDDMTTDSTATIPNPPQGKVAMRLSHTYIQSPLPGTGITYYEMSPEADSLWAMESLPKGEELPVGEQIIDKTLFFSPGEKKGITIAYRNPTKKEVNFTFLPHREVPESMSQNSWLTCLCMSFVYKAPAEGAWYRVVQLKVSPDTPVGSKIDVIWPVLTDPAVLPK